MQEVIDTADQLRSTPDLFPWVVLILIILFVFKEKEIIKEFFSSFINSRKEEALYHAKNNELVRSNTATLEKNLAAFEEAKRDRELVMKAIEAQEKMNAERMVHIQEVINRIDKAVNENKKNISIIADRINRK